MASAYSTPRDYGKPIPTHNINLVNTVLATKQGKYDSNIAKIEETISQVGNIKLLRDKDKEHLARRMDDLINTVNSNSKMDLSNNNVTRQIQKDITSAIDDQLLNAISTDRGIIQYEENVAKIKAENPDEYSDANYIYAKDKAGVESYLSGETDSIKGSLEYTPYYDIDKNLTGELEDWANKIGYEKVITEQGNTVYAKGDSNIRIEEREILSEDRIENFYNQKVMTDNRLRTQMMVNSNYQYRGYDDEEFMQSYVKDAENKYQEVGKQVAAVDAKIKNANPDNATLKSQLESQKQYLLSTQKHYNQARNPENFNREAQEFEAYSNGLLKGYKNTYATNNITDIKYEKIAQDVNNTSSATRTGLRAGAGTFQPMDINPLEETEEGTLEYQDKQYASNVTMLQNNLAQFDTDYQKLKTPEEKNQYVQTLLKETDNISVNAQPINAEVAKSIDLVKASRDNMEAVANVVKEDLDDKFSRTFNGMKGGISKDLDIQNVADFMPFTASVLQSKKDFNSLSDKEKALVKIEIANNVSNDFAGGDKDKKIIERYVDQVKSESGITDEDLKALGVSSSFTNNVGQIAGGAWDAAGGLAKNLLGVAGTAVNTFLPFARAEDLERQKVESRDTRVEGFNQIMQGMGQVVSGMDRNYDYFLGEDSSLSDINSQDLGQSQNSFGQYEGLSDVYNPDFFNSLSNRASEVIEKQQANRGETTSITFSPSKDADESYLEELQATVQGRGFNIDPKQPVSVYNNPDNGNIIINFSQRLTQERDNGSQFYVSQPQKIEVRPQDLQNLPDLAQRASAQIKPWAFSYKNPTKFEKSFGWEPPQDYQSANTFVDKYIENNRGNLTQAQIQTMASNPSAVFPTKTDLETKAVRTLTPETYPVFKQNVLDAQYNIKYKRNENQQGFLPILVKNGKEIAQMQVLTEDYDFTRFSLYTTKFINSYIESQRIQYGRGIIK